MTQANLKGVIEYTFLKYVSTNDADNNKEKSQEATKVILYLLQDGVLSDVQKKEMLGIENEASTPVKFFLERMISELKHSNEKEQFNIVLGRVKEIEREFGERPDSSPQQSITNRGGEVGRY